MSTSNEPTISGLMNEPRPSFIRLFRFPMIVLLLVAAVIAAPILLMAYGGVDSDDLAGFFFLTHWVLPLVTVLVLTVWWLLFFRGMGCLARFGVLLLAIALVGAAGAAVAVSTIRSFELTASPFGLVPRIQFAWEKSSEEELAEKLSADTSKSDGLPAIDATVGPEDFAAYRGAKTDGIVAFAKLKTDWQKDAPKVLWRQPCPGGYSGVAVAGNIVVTLQQRVKDKKEVVVCYDRATGRHRWFYEYDAYHKDVMGDGPRSTPTIHDNHIYTIGATGKLVCLTVDGKLKWSKDILEDGAAENIKWGMTGSPLIVDDLVIANPGVDPKVAPEQRPGSSLIAYEQATGKIRWKTGKRKAGYSSPQLVTLGGVPQIMIFDGEGLVGYDKTGKELWQYEWITDFEMNSIQPVVLGDDRVFISSEQKNGCAMLRIKRPANEGSTWTVEPVWDNKHLATRYANPVTDGKLLFGLHNLSGVLVCLKVDTGKVAWKGERYGPGQLLLADGVLLVVDGTTGDACLLDADGNELSRFVALEKRDKTWNTPALAGDQLFIRNQAEIVCVKLPRR
jgi:outer membrane protein assembly factor BamB